MITEINSLADAYFLLKGRKGVLLTTPDENMESFMFTNLENDIDEMGIICTILDFLSGAEPKEDVIAKNIILNCASAILNDAPIYKKKFLKSIGVK